MLVGWLAILSIYRAATCTPRPVCIRAYFDEGFMAGSVAVGASRHYDVTPTPVCLHLSPSRKRC
jgi:hypothetical protein